MAARFPDHARLRLTHDDLEALVLFADQVLYWHLDVLECDVCGSGGPDTLAVHLAGADAAEVSFDQKDRDTIHPLAACPDGSSEVVTPDTVGDPLLLTVDDVVLAILRKLGLALQVGH